MKYENKISQTSLPMLTNCYRGLALLHILKHYYIYVEYQNMQYFTFLLNKKTFDLCAAFFTWKFSFSSFWQSHNV
jgi:hypothetical protein